MNQNANDAAKVKFFPPGIPLIAIVAGLVLTNVWPLHSGMSVPAPFREEAYLESKFCDAYLDYKRRVRRWI